MEDAKRKALLKPAEAAKEQIAIAKQPLDGGIIKQVQEAARLAKAVNLEAVTPETQRWRSAFVDANVLKGIQDTTVARPLLPPNFATVASSWQQNSQAIAESLQSIGKVWREVVQSSFAPFQQVFARIAAEQKKAELVERIGWLPHYTTPFHLIDVEAHDEAFVQALLTEYYVDRWHAVEAQFLENLNAYHIDEEAKATFKEALDAHRHGLFRSVPRTLFPEIERIACNEIYGGKRTIFEETRRGKQKAINITSLPGISEAARDLPASEMLSYEFGMQLFTKMEEHLYARVGDDAEQIAKFASDPVPNRHATLHGIISYGSCQNSLNALMMTDFMFHLISRVKQYVVDEDEGHETIADGAKED
jgi:hypothetical protein